MTPDDYAAAFAYQLAAEKKADSKKPQQLHMHAVMVHTLDQEGQLVSEVDLRLQKMTCYRAKVLASRHAREQALLGSAVSLVHLVGDESAGTVWQEVMDVT